MPIELYRFRYRDRRTGKGVRARYTATPEEIAAHHEFWEVTGPPETRGDEPAQMFNPRWSIQAFTRPERPLDAPQIDDAERLLLGFLRRYLTWCARRQTFASMQGAAILACKMPAVTTPTPEALLRYPLDGTYDGRP